MKKLLDLPEEQFCRRFLRVVQIQQGLFFSYGLLCGQDRDPNWTGNALIDHADEKRRLASRTSTAQCLQASQQVT